MTEQKPLKKGTPEWKAACGRANIGNANAVKHGAYVKKPKICNESCKLSKKGCPYFYICDGKECILNIKEQEDIENVTAFKKNFLKKRININMAQMEIGEEILKAQGLTYDSDIQNLESHIIMLIEKLEKLEGDIQKYIKNSFGSKDSKGNSGDEIWPS